MRIFLLAILILTCTSCATTDPTSMRLLGIGKSVGFVIWGAAAIATGDVVGGASLIGGEVIGLGVYASQNAPSGGADAAPQPIVSSER